MKKEHIVALHLEHVESMSEAHTVRIAIYWTETLAGAFAEAVSDHVRDGWALAGWIGGELEDLRRFYAQGA